MNAALHRPWIESVAIPYEGDACLEWPFATRGGRRPQDAYPALSGTGYAHVLLCTMVYGPAPDIGMEVEHICGNKLCMNKRHVAWAFHTDNCARRTEHGTQTIGEKHPGAKLTEQDINDIRGASMERGSGARLAEKYNVTPGAISLIRAGKLWRHML